MKTNLVYIVPQDKKNVKCIASLNSSVTTINCYHAANVQVTQAPITVSTVFVSSLDSAERHEFNVLMNLVDYLRHNQVPPRDDSASDFVQLKHELEFVSENCLRLFRELTIFDHLPSSLQYSLLCHVVPKCIILRANLFVEDNVIPFSRSGCMNIASYPFEFKKLTNCIAMDGGGVPGDRSSDNGQSGLLQFFLEYITYFNCIPEALRKDITVAALLAVNLLYTFLLQSHSLPFHLYRRVAQDHAVHVSLMNKLLAHVYGDDTLQQIMQTNAQLERVTQSFQNVTLHVIPYHRPCHLDGLHLHETYGASRGQLWAPLLRTK